MDRPQKQLLGGLFCLCFGSWKSLLAFSVVLSAPRLLWQPGRPAEGAAYIYGLGLYWNIVMASCFASPLLMVACCWRHPWLLLPTLGYVLWSRLNRVELKDGAAWPWFSKQEWGYHVPWLNTFSLNSLRCEAFRRYLQLRIHVHPELQERPPESLGYQRFKIFKYI